MGRKSKDDIEAACYVYWGTYMDCYESEYFLPAVTETPEMCIINSDLELLKSLPDECRILARAILNLEDKQFLLNGKVRKDALYKALRKKVGWDSLKIKEVEQSLAKELLNK